MQEWMSRWTAEVRRRFHGLGFRSLATEVLRGTFKLATKGVTGLRSWLGWGDGGVSLALTCPAAWDAPRAKRARLGCDNPRSVAFLGSAIVWRGQLWKTQWQISGKVLDPKNRSKWRRTSRGRPCHDWEHVFVHVWGDEWG